MSVLNIMLLGDTGVGKTSIINRFKANIFSAEHIGTLGVAGCGLKDIVYQGQAVKLALYDAAGSNQYYEEIKGKYVKDSHGIVLVVSPTEAELAAGFPENFITRAKANIEFWKTWCDKIPKFDKDTPIVIAINKIDLIPASDLPKIKSELTTVARVQKIHLEIFFTSAKTGAGIVANPKQVISNTLLFDRVAELAFNKAHHIKVEVKPDYVEPWLLSQISGAFLAMLTGPITAALVYNPLAGFYYQISLDQWRAHRFLNLFLIIGAPFFYPFAGIVGQGFIKQIEAGWRDGFIRGLKTPLEVLKDRKIESEIDPKEEPNILQKETKMPVRAVIVSLIITALVAAAVGCILFPPAGVAVLLPTWIAMAGLSGFSTLALATMTGVAVATVLSLPFLIGDNIYRFFHPQYQLKAKTIEDELRPMKVANRAVAIDGSQLKRLHDNSGVINSPKEDEQGPLSIHYPPVLAPTQVTNGSNPDGVLPVAGQQVTVFTASV